MKGQRLVRWFAGRPVTESAGPIDRTQTGLDSVNQVAGSVDRAQAGLVSGWLQCPDCEGPPAVTVEVGGAVVVGRLTPTPRPDVPGGSGFLVRFAPDHHMTDALVQVRIQCEQHPNVRIDHEVAGNAWAVPALGQIEHLAWPLVSGWIAEFAAPTGSDPLRLEIAGLRVAPVQPSIARPDVQAFLGSEGVAGFQIDFGDVLGYAVPEGSVVRLCRGEQALHEATVAASPIGDGTGSCLDPDDRTIREVDDALLAGLIRRFRSTPISATAEGDWIDLLEAIGIQDHSTSTRQWATFLAAKGMPSDVIAGRLALRAVQGLRVPVLDPLPRDVTSKVAADSTLDLPARIDAWREGVLGLDLPTGAEPVAAASRAATPTTESQTAALPRVCVAGLVHHKSGLGQHASNSLTALASAGIHACAEPFFPAPGGWSPNLAANPGAAAALREHIVLLHLPIDRVVPSMSAQPALLASPRVIGYFYWETEVIPRQLHRPLDLVDEIWAATEFVANGYRAVTDTPVKVTGNSVDVSGVEELARSEFGIAEDAFVVHFSFDANSTVARKNPNAAIDAFHRAFDGDPTAVFILKVRNMQQAEHLARQGDPHAKGLLQRLREVPAIRLVSSELSRARTLGLIQLADCYISLHRSEGYGYSLAEAMALGTPAIATDYSGSVDFLSEQEGWPVAYELVDVLPEEYFYWEPGMRWAEPDVAAAAAALTKIRAGSDVAERVAAARARIAAECSIQQLSANYASMLTAG